MAPSPISIRRAPARRLARSSASAPRPAAIRCASPSCIRIRGTITNCATGSPPAASIRSARSRSSSCRRPSWPTRWPPGASTATASASPGTAPAVAAGTGHIVTVKALIWRNSPEKVIGVRKAWAEQHPEALAALLRALHHSARWCQDPANHGELAAVMAQPGFLGLPPAVQMPILTGHLQSGRRRGADCRRLLPALRQGGELSRGRAMRCGSTRRWCAGGRSAHTPANLAIARDCYRPDLYRAALKPLGVALARRQCEGRGRADAWPRRSAATGASLVLGPDGFFDGQIFDPDEIDAYIAAPEIGPRPRPDHFRAILVHCTKIVRAIALMNNLWPARHMA